MRIRIVDCECSHRMWRPVRTPPESSSQWYRCRRCGAYGFKKSTTCAPYKCGVRGCENPAVDRLTGRTNRLGMRWRCGGHIAAAIHARLNLRPAVAAVVQLRATLKPARPLLPPLDVGRPPPPPPMS